MQRAVARPRPARCGGRLARALTCARSPPDRAPGREPAAAAGHRREVGHAARLLPALGARVAGRRSSPTRSCALKREIVLCEECFDLDRRARPARSAATERATRRCSAWSRSPPTSRRSSARGASRGRYHVLGGALSPIDGIGPERAARSPSSRRACARRRREVILATNPNAEGDATAHYLAERLRPLGVRLTRIAYGMPLGGDLEYADHVTSDVAREPPARSTESALARPEARLPPDRPTPVRTRRLPGTPAPG